jgi:hypothetical protein
LSGHFPTPAEAAGLRFLLPLGGLGARFVLSGALFALGLAGWCLGAGPQAAIGLGLLVIGHLPLWVRTQTIAPGGATPQHEDVWAPVEDDWLRRVEALEQQGERWDTTPWDVSNALGFLSLLGVLLVVAAAAFLAGTVFGPDALFRLAVAAALLLVPLWFNGMRTTWNPSELRKKGEALAVARATLQEVGGKDFDLVPLLALREGPHGHYPVDARLMARPAHEDAIGFLGVQVQVSLNNVQGKDYPYLYAVILGKDGFRFPAGPSRAHERGVSLVFEDGRSAGVRYRVVRQYADKNGGWHTEPDDIRGIVATAVAKAREAWRETGGPA